MPVQQTGVSPLRHGRQQPRSLILRLCARLRLPEAALPVGRADSAGEKCKRAPCTLFISRSLLLDGATWHSRRPVLSRRFWFDRIFAPNPSDDIVDHAADQFLTNSTASGHTGSARGVAEAMTTVKIKPNQKTASEEEMIVLDVVADSMTRQGRRRKFATIQFVCIDLLRLVSLRRWDGRNPAFCRGRAVSSSATGCRRRCNQEAHRGIRWSAEFARRPTCVHQGQD